MKQLFWMRLKRRQGENSAKTTLTQITQKWYLQMNVLLKEENKDAESDDQIKIIIEYHMLIQNAMWMYGIRFVLMKISLKF